MKVYPFEFCAMLDRAHERKHGYNHHLTWSYIWKVVLPFQAIMLLWAWVFGS